MPMTAVIGSAANRMLSPLNPLSTHVQMKADISAAAAGEAKPTNQRLSTCVACELNRARRRAPQAAYKNAAIQPNLPSVAESWRKNSSDQ